MGSNEDNPPLLHHIVRFSLLHSPPCAKEEERQHLQPTKEPTSHAGNPSCRPDSCSNSYPHCSRNMPCVSQDWLCGRERCHRNSKCKYQEVCTSRFEIYISSSGG